MRRCVGGWAAIMLLLAGCSGALEGPPASSPTPTLLPVTPTPQEETQPPTSSLPPAAMPSPTPSPTPMVTPTPETASSPTAPPTSTPAPLTASCPEGMKGLWDTAGELRYCVDTYEVTFSGELGSRDQFVPEGVPTQAVVESVAGVIPGTQISWGQAYRACEKTPVLSRAGAVVGYKQLVWSTLWEDACDGTLGVGGQEYPYGSSFDENACVTLDSSGQQVYHSLQPTGSFPLCVSGFGLYDLTGNAWEWANPRMNLDITAWFNLALSAGLEVVWDGYGRLRSDDPLAVKRLIIQMMGFQPSALQQDESGLLYLVPGDFIYTEDEFGGAPRGYLVQSGPDPTQSQDCASCFLPIEVVPADLADPEAPFYLTVSWRSDGQPITDKRGGAYYTVPSPSCHSRQMVHFHDTHGTIGFRCMSLPVWE